MTLQTATFLIALATAILLTPIMRLVALRLRFIDEPNHRKLHLRPTPLLGGMAIYLAVLAGFLPSLSHVPTRQAMALFASGTFILLVGLFDDRLSLSARVKLWGAIPFAGLILVLGGIRVTAFPLSPMLRGFPELSLFVSVVLTVLWLVVVTAAFSILDHMDGLCSGVTAIAAFFFLLFALGEGQLLVGILSAALMGANLGFLRWNFRRPASIFMGDTGALFIGVMMSALAILVRFMETTTWTSWMTPLLVLGVAFFDTALVVISRLRRGIAPSSSPGKDHAAHRLANLGLGQSKAVLVLYGAGIVLGIIALVIVRLSLFPAYVLGASVLLVGLVSIVGLESVTYERQESTPELSLKTLPAKGSSGQTPSPRAYRSV